MGVCIGLCAAAVAWEFAQRSAARGAGLFGRALQSVPITEDGRLFLEAVTLFGDGAVREGQRVALYSHSGIAFVMPQDGVVVLSLSGVAADGIWPALNVEIGTMAPTGHQMSSAQQDLTLGPVTAGQVVVVQFSNDGFGADGVDRNLWIDQIQLK